MNCPTTWCGAATNGRSAFKLPTRRSERPYAASSRSNASRTRPMFMTTAATYQIPMREATTTITGARSASPLPILPRMRGRVGRGHKDRSRGHGRDAALAGSRALLVIGMPQAQTHAHPPGDFQEFGRLADFKRAVPWQIAGDHINDAAGARR